jgi:hypothetical protein
MSTINLLKALNSFAGFRGATMPTDPTNQEEFSALKNAVDGGSCWSGVIPTWSQVEAKVAEYDDEETQKVTDKTTGNQKLLDLGLTQAEVDALTGQ